MIAACTKCHQLYEGLETEPLAPVHFCPRCQAVDDLLSATASLITQVRRKLPVAGALDLTRAISGIEAAAQKVRAT